MKQIEFYIEDAFKIPYLFRNELRYLEQVDLRYIKMAVRETAIIL